jgi:hypothetical protein
LNKCGVSYDVPVYDMDDIDDNNEKGEEIDDTEEAEVAESDAIEDSDED